MSIEVLCRIDGTLFGIESINDGGSNQSPIQTTRLFLHGVLKCKRSESHFETKLLNFYWLDNNLLVPSCLPMSIPS